MTTSGSGSGFCDYHATHDAYGRPTGQACGRPATHRIDWPTLRTYSLACPRHARPAIFAADAPPFRISGLHGGPALTLIKEADHVG